MTDERIFNLMKKLTRREMELIMPKCGKIGCHSKEAHYHAQNDTLFFQPVYINKPIEEKPTMPTKYGNGKPSNVNNHVTELEEIKLPEKWDRGYSSTMDDVWGKYNEIIDCMAQIIDRVKL